jgi:hypothetical protein
MSPPIEITRLAKIGGPLTKHISLAVDGSLKSDGSACLMGSGVARRAQFSDLPAFADCIANLARHEAIALGSLRLDLPDPVGITIKDKLAKSNGAARPDLIARTGGHIVYRIGEPALALLDFDTKGMPSYVAARLDALGGFWNALVSVLPELASTARVTRRSTSAGIYRTDTREKLSGSDGLHVFVPVKDGTDTVRFLTNLHARCWLARFGWLMVGASGQLLERSIVDRMVGAPERLVFEGAPVLEEPLAQDQENRRPIVTDGDVLDTVATCPPLTIVEAARLDELRAKEKVRLASDIAVARKAFVSRHAPRLAERAGISNDRAVKIVERGCAGVLLPHFELPFDDSALAGTTVADVLASPDKYEGATLADPLEGIEYGRDKAKIMLRINGDVWIHSFAHGRIVYELRYDAHAAEAAIQQAPPDQAGDLFVRLVLAGDLDAIEMERLRRLTSQRSGIGLQTLTAAIRETRRGEKARQKKRRTNAGSPSAPIRARRSRCRRTMILGCRR